MSELVQRNVKFFKLLGKLTPRKRKEVLKHAPAELIQAYSEGAFNVLKGNVKLSKKKFAALKRHKKKLETLARQKGSQKSKKAVLCQRGGFVGLLASVLIPAITGIISAATNT